MKNETRPNKPSAIGFKEVIIWAIDPFEKETRPDRTLIHQLKNWASTSGLRIQPVYILSLPLEESGDFFEGAGTSTYLSAAEKASERYLQDLGVEGVLPVKVIFAESPSRKVGVAALLRFANEVHPPYIVVSSHGRSGVPRLLLGSFAENLLLDSSYPVIFLTHLKSAGPRHSSTRTIFATDFSQYSYKAFNTFLYEAKRLHLDVTLLHSVSLSPQVLVSDYGAPYVIPEDFFKIQVEWAKGEGEKWVKLSESRGVRTRLVVKDDGVVPNVGETILSVADRIHAELIVMASMSGPFTSSLMGSVAHDVFRSNRYPVWIYGSNMLEKTLNRRIEVAATARA